MELKIGQTYEDIFNHRIYVVHHLRGEDILLKPLSGGLIETVRLGRFESSFRRVNA